MKILDNVTRRQALLLSALAPVWLSPLTSQAKPESDYYAFSYFKNKDNGAAGMRLAVSDDGLKYRSVRGGRSLLSPAVGEAKLMRDPCILKDPHRDIFHMVWTTAWEGVTIGYARSTDLLNWSTQKAIPVMSAFPGVRNCWAPEVIFDPQRGEFVIFWSSTVTGAFSEHAGQSEDGYNHRLYYTTTKDFETFAPTRLLYDPAFSVIDATFLRHAGKLYMFVKDERLKPERKYLQWCEAASPTGPFGPLSAPFTESWVEGPTAISREGEVVVFYDKYKQNRYAASATRDLKTWRDFTSEIEIPEGASHGTIIPIRKVLYDFLTSEL